MLPVRAPPIPKAPFRVQAPAAGGAVACLLGRSPGPDSLPTTRTPNVHLPDPRISEHCCRPAHCLRRSAADERPRLQTSDLQTGWAVTQLSKNPNLQEDPPPPGTRAGRPHGGRGGASRVGRPEHGPDGLQRHPLRGVGHSQQQQRLPEHCAAAPHIAWVQPKGREVFTSVGRRRRKGNDQRRMAGSLARRWDRVWWRMLRASGWHDCGSESHGARNPRMSSRLAADVCVPALRVGRSAARGTAVGPSLAIAARTDPSLPPSLCA